MFNTRQAYININQTFKILLLAVGIMGITWREKIEKSQILFLGGLICIAVYIIPHLINFDILAFSMSLISLIVPILFVVGASKNKAEMKETDL